MPTELLYQSAVYMLDGAFSLTTCPDTNRSTPNASEMNLATSHLYKVMGCLGMITPESAAPRAISPATEILAKSLQNQEGLLTSTMFLFAPTMITSGGGVPLAKTIPSKTKAGGRPEHVVETRREIGELLERYLQCLLSLKFHEWPSFLSVVPTALTLMKVYATSRIDHHTMALDKGIVAISLKIHFISSEPSLLTPALLSMAFVELQANELLCAHAFMRLSLSEFNQTNNLSIY